MLLIYYFSGILSLFMAQAGAKKVFAVEASKMAEVAANNVKENNLENIIEVNSVYFYYSLDQNDSPSFSFIRFFIQRLKICQKKFKLTL